jgi:hypothetical protein
MGDISRVEYVARKRELEAALEGGRPQPMYSERVLADAARLLSDLGRLWSKATPSQRGEIAQGLFSEIDVFDDRIVRARLARPEYLPLIASATLRARTSVARPEGFGRAGTTSALRQRLLSRPPVPGAPVSEQPERGSPLPRLGPGLDGRG